MGKQLSRALEMRRSVSGTRSQNARVARRVARAGLTTGVSFDDTMDDLCLKPFLCRLSWPLFLLFSLVLWILALRALTFFIHTHHIFVLGPAISNLMLSSPNPLHISLSVPRNPTLTYTHIHIIQYTHMRRFSFAFTLFCCITVSSSISICAPFFISGLFRSLCPNSICLCFACSRIVSHSPLLLLLL